MSRSMMLVALVLSLGAAAAADPRETANSLNSEGRKRFDEHEFATALELFQRAYLTYPSAGLLLNIGTTFQQMGRAVDAANTYQRYLDSSGAQEPLASQTRQSLAILDTGVGRVALAAMGEGELEVQVGDGTWWSLQGGSTVRVAPGTFVIRARRGARAGEATGRIGAGEQLAIAIKLAQAPSPIVVVPEIEATDDAPTPPLAPRDRRRTIAIAVASGGALALAGSGVFALRSRSRYASASAECDGDPTCASGNIERARDLSDSGSANRWAAISFGVVGVAAITTSAVLWFKAPAATRTVTAMIGQRDLGVAITGTF